MEILKKYWFLIAFLITAFFSAAGFSIRFYYNNLDLQKRADAIEKRIYELKDKFEEYKKENDIKINALDKQADKNTFLIKLIKEK